MKDFFVNNRNKLINEINDNEIVVLFSGKPPKSTADDLYKFKPNKNFYYFTGLTRENFIVTMLKLKDSVEIKLFIEEPNYDVEKWYGIKLSKEKAMEISGIEDVEYIDEFKKYLNRMVYSNKFNTVYFDLEKLSWDEVDTYSHKFALEFRNRYLHINIRTVHNIASKLRLIKDKFEIDQIRKAISLTKLGIEDIMKNLKPGMYEYQIESIFANNIKQNGAGGNAFETIVASGKNAVILHYVENDKKIKKDELVLLDLGAQYNQYSSDITRTLPIDGKFTDRQKEIYEIVLKAQKATIKIMKPETPFEELNKECEKVLCNELKKIGLMKEDSELANYYYHGVGHYMGLDTHDLGSRDVMLKPGMVITCEPGLYIAEENIGIRIEDDILITKNGNEILSKEITKEIKDIEQFMK